MNNRKIRHHFDMLDEMEEKENLRSKPTLINYPRIRTFKLRINGRVILSIPPFCLAALLLWTVCYLFPSAPFFLVTAKFFVLSLAIIEMVLYLVSGAYRDEDDD